ncbi:MoaD/ThiS family protein [Desulfurococcaceae archaeon MEX13E-LK6-19]|nr:MoaD/ThiS family protein [Desulfurococcaceae archaeon MEX13E-LK6-19]
MPRIIVEYKMWLREKIGKEYEELELSPGSTLADLVTELVSKYSVLKNIMGDHGGTGLITLVNGRTVPSNYVLKDGDKVIVLPPVSGG